MKLVCDWGHEPSDAVLHRHCPECRAPLTFRYEAPIRLGTDRGMWRFADRLPAGAGRKVTLGEGDTPLIRTRLDLGCQTYWKVEARNPTGSQKDRALAVAVVTGSGLREMDTVAQHHQPEIPRLAAGQALERLRTDA